MFANERRLGIIIMLLAATGYAFLPIIARSLYAVSDFQPTDVAIWRFLFAAPAIWLVIGLRRRPAQPESSGRPLRPGPLLLLGALYAGAALAAFIGLERAEASVYVVLFYTYPAMVAILSVFLGQPLTPRAWLALGLTLIGVFLTIPDPSALGQTDSVGVLFAFINAFVVALYFLASGRVLRGVTDIARSSAWIITATLLLLLLIVPFNGLSLPQNVPTLLNLLALSIFSTAGPIFLINLGIQKIGAAPAAIVSAIEPGEAMLLAVLLLGETVTGVQWLGALLIVIAVVLLELRGIRRKSPLTTPD